MQQIPSLSIEKVKLTATNVSLGDNISFDKFGKSHSIIWPVSLFPVKGASRHNRSGWMIDGSLLCNISRQ
jgi:hypothetical protein